MCRGVDCSIKKRNVMSTDRLENWTQMVKFNNARTHALAAVKRRKQNQQARGPNYPAGELDQQAC
jgi:hypothetical protein